MPHFRLTQKQESIRSLQLDSNVILGDLWDEIFREINYKWGSELEFISATTNAGRGPHRVHEQLMPPSPPLIFKKNKKDTHTRGWKIELQTHLNKATTAADGLLLFKTYVVYNSCLETNCHHSCFYEYI